MPGGSDAVKTSGGFLCLLFVVIIWGTNWLVIKDALHSSPPLFFTGGRLLGGAIAIPVLLILVWTVVYPNVAVIAGSFENGL